MSDVTIVEVAPRDGFQVVKPFIATDLKIQVAHALGETGIKRLEIGAFVSPKAIPQMADITDVLAAFKPSRPVRTQVLVPNRRGFEAALAAGCREICWVLSLSESHNQNNVRRSVEQSFVEFEETWSEFGADLMAPAANGETGFLRFNFATSFDCPFEGRIDEARVVAGVERILKIAPKLEFGIADTTGRAATDHVRLLFRDLVDRYQSDDVAFCFHGHDTYNLGVANALAAYESGVRVIDGAAGGLGGCPFAPGASGNTATEDLVFAFEHMGVDTGIDLARLLDAADLAANAAPEQAAGRIRGVPRARVLSGFGAAARGVAA
ncbi:MAG: hydroxymethylglutaryl-CoA lyase [Pseudomonadota bacterium]